MRMPAVVSHRYQYRERSDVSRGRVRLSTSPGPTTEGAEPFVRARVRSPRAVALAMRLVSDVVRSRHHIPPAMLERILLEADPVLTVGGDVLRVEGFSSCCGIYARADIAESALDATEFRPGTTNVDFHDEMRGALGRVRDGDELELEVGATGVAVAHNAGQGATTVFERKVALPLRWLLGFVEVQAIQARMEARLELDRAAAVRFVRGLPRSGRASDASWVVPSGRSVRLSSSPRDGSVRVAGMSRVRAMEPGLALARRVTVYDDPTTGASAWQLMGDEVTLTVVLSPEAWRGFSGEGQVLRQLATAAPTLSRVRAMLSWQSEIGAAELCAKAGLARDEAGAVLAWLSTQGLVGFDVGRGAWFHRVLPFHLETARELLDAQHPRLRHARTLVESGAVTVEDRGDEVRGEVKSGEVVHRVRISPAGDHCTCPWFAKHQGERGPCKHVLAVELQLAQKGGQ